MSKNELTGQNLMEMRKDKKISQKELSEKTGIARTTITSYEKGSRKISTKHSTLLNEVLGESKNNSTSSRKEIDVGMMLKSFRKENNLKQSELADILNVDTSLLGKIERGIRKPSKKVNEIIDELLSKSINTVAHRLIDDKGKFHFPSVDKIAVGERISLIRKQREETLEAFGNQFTRTVGKNVISRWEKGVNIPDIERMMNLAFLGDTTETYILYGDSYQKMLKESDAKVLYDKVDPKIFGRRLRKIRKEKKLERTDLGILFDPVITKWSLDRYENGKDIPNTERIIQYAYIGDVSLDFLIYGK
ncbi:helix-turn-helix domain-containing protein [Enterococcus faecalis]|uniref:helix-turn-helix domain-containing protein n=1 Tax=Enterococcus TaxID=1350 RepID=UPI001A97015B|nr:helix-turn-helix domain-containing protein [Enterococcus faecalis]